MQAGELLNRETYYHFQIISGGAIEMQNKINNMKQLVQAIGSRKV